MPHLSILDPWLHRLAWAVAGGTFVMIVAGSLVTTMKAGDSVPDWPLSFGEIFPEKEFYAGVRYEHTHRMIGWAVGFLTILLSAGLFTGESARSAKALGAAALLALLVQGALGGLRVLVISSPEVQTWVAGLVAAGTSPATLRIGIAVVHAGLAQTVLSLFVALGLVTSPAWRREAREVATAPRGLVPLGTMAVALVYVQLVLGSLARHTPDPTWIYVHLGFAYAVLATVVLLATRASAVLPVRREALLAGLLAGVQVALGLAAWYARVQVGDDFLGEPPLWAALLRTGHVAVGAATLATVLALALGAHHHVRPAEAVL